MRFIPSHVGRLMAPQHTASGPDVYEAIADEVIYRDCYGVAELAEQPIRTVVDLGASFGPFTALSAATWPAARIMSFEPDAIRWACLATNFENAGRSISIRDTMVVGHFPKNWRRFVVHSGQEQFVDRWRERAQSVATSGLPREIDLLKIDVEGAELGILDELASLRRLERIKHIRGEWHFTRSRDGIAHLLRRTHRLRICDGGSWNLFRADRK